VLLSTKAAAAVVGCFAVVVVSVPMMVLLGLFLAQEPELFSSSRSSIHPTLFILDIMLAFSRFGFACGGSLLLVFVREMR